MIRWFIRILGLLAALLLVALAYNSLRPPVSTLMLAHWVRGEPVQRVFVPLSRISPQLVRAVIAAEDGRFCQHHGIDWQAMRHAAEKAIDATGKRAGGASTLTMQTAKNLFLWHGRSYLRKALEAPLALGLDAVWSKRQLMQSYLNIAEFGRGIYGAEAAARHYFGVPASALSARQAALLAATLPSPKRRNAAAPSAFVAGYADSIAARVRQGVDTGCLRAR